MTRVIALCPFQRKQRPLQCDYGFPRLFNPTSSLLLCRGQGEDLRGSRGGNIKGWFHLCSLRGAVVVKNHTPPRPFGRDHHLDSSILPTCRAQACHSYPRVCSICRSLGWPPAIYNNHTAVQCSILTEEEHHRALGDAMRALEEKTQQEEDNMQGPVTPSS